MAKRGSRGFGNADRHGQYSATTIATLPSGTTVGKASITTPKIDFGQGTAYKIYRGTAGVSGSNTFDSRISAGTAQLDTGLTSVSEFFFSKEMSSGVTVGSTQSKHLANVEIIVKKGYAGGAGVTLVFFYNGSAVTAGNYMVTPHAGTSIQWTAIGT